MRPAGAVWASGALSVIRDTDGELLGFGKSLTNRTDFKGKIDALENLIESQRQAEATQVRNVQLAVRLARHTARGRGRRQYYAQPR